MNQKNLLLLSAAAFLFSVPLHGATLLTTGVYDEQDVQTNSVNHEMGFSSNTTWTTGIGQTLGADQIIPLEDFKTQVAAAHANGRGGVINFDGVNPDDYSGMQSFGASFADGAKTLTFENRIDGSYSINDPRGDRTAISGDQFLATSGNPHFDFNLTNFVGFEQHEQVVSIGVTVLGRDGQGTGRNFRVIARYTDGNDTGSSSTFRSFDMENGNTTEDSFSGIMAPDGYWITSLRVHSDNGIFTGIDDLAFTTTIIPEPRTVGLSTGIFALFGVLWLRRRQRV